MSQVSLMQENNWLIQEAAFKVNHYKHFEGVFTTGNGYLSVRGSFEEGLKDENQAEEYMRLPMNVSLEKSNLMVSKWGTYVPGVAGVHPLLKEVMVNLPWMLEFKMWLDEEQLSMDNCTISEYSRSLNMQDGTLIRSFLWKTKQGQEVKVSFERFVSMDCDHLCVQRVKLDFQKGSGKLKVAAGINGNVRTNGYNHFTSFKSSKENGFIQTEVITDKGQQVIQGAMILSNGENLWDVKQENNHIFFETVMDCDSHSSHDFTKLCAIATSRDLHGIDPFVTVKETLKEHAGITYELLKNKHTAVWENLWLQSDIGLKGNDQLQISVRFSLYHLLRSNVRKDPRVAIDAKGHAGEAYFGRYFWDTEIYLLPFFIYTNPEAAKNLVLYRYNTLQGAKQNAAAYGYKGARYAWESGLTGEEQCPNWQYADHEVHITADVAYGLWHYYKATGDNTFLMDHGFEILVETARYWRSRVYKNNSGVYELSGVMGPDEYSPFSKNNAFTNYLVKFNLGIVSEAAGLIKEYDQNNYLSLQKKLKITEEEYQQFETLKEGLGYPKDENRNLILQSEDFESYEEIDFNTVWKDRSKPFGHYISQEKMYRSKCLKQADVLTLLMLFPNRFTEEEMKSAYYYYEPITTHDSSLSPSTHSIIASWIRNQEEAERFFLQTAGIDLDLNKLGAAEGIHIANAGGIWQAIIHGFCGVRNAVQSEKLELKPLMPSFVQEISFPYLWKGNRIRFTLNPEKILLENEGDNQVVITLKNEDIILAPKTRIEKELH